MAKPSLQPMEHRAPKRGRGTASNPPCRFDSLQRSPEDDGWNGAAELRAGPATELIPDASRSLISRNRSPDVPFDRSVNPYRGCEHGCAYCFARPTHAYLGFSPGLDFETRILFKADAAKLLLADLARPGYRCQPIALGANTDAYQPAERRLGITRQILEVLFETRHPTTLITKSALVERDLDLLAEMAEQRLVQVILSFTTLDSALARKLEPRAAAPSRRLASVQCIASAGIPVGILAAPVIPALTDAELESILARARDAGARFADYVLLRLPRELKGLFQEWLDLHEPLRAERVMNQIRACRGGAEYAFRFGERMQGTGPIAELIGQRFQLALRRLGYRPPPELETGRFRPPRQSDTQLALF